VSSGDTQAEGDRQYRTGNAGDEHLGPDETAELTGVGTEHPGECESPAAFGESMPAPLNRVMLCGDAGARAFLAAYGPH
jgi:hypothetical protein